MKIRRYTCTDMQEAMLKVKMELGSEAVIMSSRKVKKKGLFGLFSKPMVEVVAAIDDDYAKPARPSQPARQAAMPDGVPPVYRNTQQGAAPAVQPYSPPAVGYQQVQAQYASQMHYQQPHAQEAAAVPYPGYPQPQAPIQNQPQMPQMQPQPQSQALPQSQSPQPHPAQAFAASAPSAQVQQAQPLSNQPPSHEPLTAPQSAAAANPSEVQNGENEKIVELESKVRNMESMLEQIYKAVHDKNDTPPSSAVTVEQIVPQPAPANALVQDDKDSLGILRTALNEQELDSRLIDKILEKVREKGGNSLKLEDIFALAARVMQVLLGEPDTISLRSDGKPQVVVFIGPTGVGKTTTLAKLAADFTLNKQKKVGLITADTYRIAAVEQLKTYAEILNIPVTVVYSPNEIKDAVRKLSDKDLVLIDTAGRSHKNKSHFDELKTLVNAIGADEIYLVMSANTSKAAAREILEYYSFIKNYKLLFTKLDETPVPGIIINSRYLTGRPLSYTTAGQSVPDDLDIANPKAIASCFAVPKRTNE